MNRPLELEGPPLPEAPSSPTATPPVPSAERLKASAVSTMVGSVTMLPGSVGGGAHQSVGEGGADQSVGGG